jgi:hypothetical protein
MPQSGCGPVAMVRMQKIGIKYKKPIVFPRCAQGAFQLRIIDCDDVVAGMGRGAVKLGRTRGRTGGLGTYFFTQNPGNIFFKGSDVGTMGAAKVKAKR